MPYIFFQRIQAETMSVIFMCKSFSFLGCSKDRFLSLLVSKVEAEGMSLKSIQKASIVSALCKQRLQVTRTHRWCHMVKIKVIKVSTKGPSKCFSNENIMTDLTLE